MLIPDIRRLEEGDSASWDCAFHWLWPVAYSAAQRRMETIAPQEIEDVAIGAIREAAEQVAGAHVDTFDGLKALTSVIANRRAMDLIRRRLAGRRSTTATESIEEQGETLAGTDPGPAEQANANDVARLLCALMERLPGGQYELLRAYYFLGLKQREIAEVLSMPLGTVGVGLSKSLVSLREEIRKYPDLMQDLL